MGPKSQGLIAQFGVQRYLYLRHGLAARIRRFHRRGQGSIPCGGNINFFLFFSQSEGVFLPEASGSQLLRLCGVILAKQCEGYRAISGLSMTVRPERSDLMASMF